MRVALERTPRPPSVAKKAVASIAAFAAATTLAPPCFALDRFEIQVYEADMNKPGQFGLELHTNYTLKGTSTPDYEGQVPPHHVARFTLEPALGVTRWLELGAYLQMLVGPDVGAQWGGWKVRAKFVLPNDSTRPWFFGINMELGRVPTRVEEEGWANEFRPIIGFDNGHILLDVNPIFGYALTGPDKFKPEFEPAGKIAVNTQRGFSIGAEYYAELGLVTRGFEPLRAQEHMLFGTFDLTNPANAKEEDDTDWELNIGVGRSLTSAPGPEWVAKAIVGRAF
jgi:hypothetical protein